LLQFQEDRFSRAFDELALRLQDLGYWPDGVLLELDGSGSVTMLDPQAEGFSP
jgi:hypothetical protein